MTRGVREVFLFERRNTMAKNFFGFALASSMFNGNVSISRRILTIEEAKKIIAAGVESCCNPSHEATVKAMEGRYGISVAMPEKPPIVSLTPGDTIIVMGVRGLPRLTDRHHYSEEEVAKATFEFVEYSVAPSGGLHCTDAMLEEVWRLMGLGCPVQDALHGPMLKWAETKGYLKDK
jgi:hypothetical protein